MPAGAVGMLIQSDPALSFELPDAAVVGLTAAYFVVGGLCWMLSYTLTLARLPSSEVRRGLWQQNIMTYLGIDARCYYCCCCSCPWSCHAYACAHMHTLHVAHCPIVLDFLLPC